MFKDLYTSYILSVFLLFSLVFSSNSNSDNDNRKSVNIDVIEQNYDYLIIKYSINHYDTRSIEYNNENYTDIILDGEPDFIIKGSPKLPHVNRSVIIPDTVVPQLKF